MSRMLELDLKPEPRTLRQFGWLVLAFFSGLALLAWREALLFSFGLGAAREPVALALLAVGGTAALFSLVAPRANRPLYVALTVLAYPVGFVVSYVILTLLFYAVIVPVGLLLRLLGKDPMHRSLHTETSSYWSVARAARPASDYFRQF